MDAEVQHFSDTLLRCLCWEAKVRDSQHTKFKDSVCSLSDQSLDSQFGLNGGQRDLIKIKEPFFNQFCKLYKIKLANFKFCEKNKIAEIGR